MVCSLCVNSSERSKLNYIYRGVFLQRRVQISLHGFDIEVCRKLLDVRRVNNLESQAVA
jgi:hypothetical protein